MHARPAAHRTRHPPQWFGSERVSTSQPLELLPSQLAIVPGHAEGPHRPLVQYSPGACGLVTKNVHTRPQTPQELKSARLLASQPLAAMPSQSAKSCPSIRTHAATAHSPATHREVALARTQRRPQAPQFIGSVMRSGEHPASTTSGAEETSCAPPASGAGHRHAPHPSAAQVRSPMAPGHAQGSRSPVEHPASAASGPPGASAAVARSAGAEASTVGQVHGPSARPSRVQTWAPDAPPTHAHATCAPGRHRSGPSCAAVASGGGWSTPTGATEHPRARRAQIVSQGRMR